jgi:fumarylacetoacetase
MNDWSARDIQKWEYVPLGPFGSKNFGTSVSPWVVMLDALEPFRCPTSVGQQDPAPLPYLADPEYSSYNIALEVAIKPSGGAEGGATDAAPSVVSRSNFRHLYWTIKQQLVHHTVTGCNINPGET